MKSDYVQGLRFSFLKLYLLIAPVFWQLLLWKTAVILCFKGVLCELFDNNEKGLVIRKARGAPSGIVTMPWNIRFF